MTDLKCGEYYDELAKPKYKEGDYFGGTKEVLAKYIDVLSPTAREYRDKQEKEIAAASQRSMDYFLSGIGYFIFYVVAFGLIIFGIRRNVKKKEEKEARDYAVKQQEKRDFDKIMERYLSCSGEVRKLIETLDTSPFKSDADKIKEVLGDLTDYIVNFDLTKINYTKGFLEAYIEKYNERLKSVRVLIEEVNKKTSILTNAKNSIDKNNETLLVKNNDLVIDLGKALKEMVFNHISYEDTLKTLSSNISNIRSISNSMMESYKICDTDALIKLSDELNKHINSYHSGSAMLRSVLDEDAGKIRVANTGKDTLTKQIAMYASYCGRSGVSANASKDTKEKCEALLEQVNHQFSNDVVANYNVYNALNALLSNLSLAKKEYDAEQARLQKIKDEEDRKRKEEERKRREKEEEEERKRRKKRQDDEDEERRRRDSYNSSSSIMSSINSSSSSSSSSFGGGSFDGSGGGGGGGSW